MSVMINYLKKYFNRRAQERKVTRMAGRHLTGSKVGLYVFMILMVCFTMLPFVYIINSAFKPLNELYLFPPTFFVKNPTTRNFSDLIISIGSSSVPFLRYIFNSVVVSIMVVALTTVISAMGAYSLVKLDLPCKGLIFNIIIAALMFSTHVTTIPKYLIVNSLGLYDSYAALIITCIAVPYNFFLMKQFLEQFPSEIMEAARIDGSGEWHLFSRIVMPSQGPVVATLVVMTFVSTWNDYFTPLVYTSSQTMKTLPLALQTISGGAGAASVGRAGAVAAATLIMVLPVAILFTVMQGKVMATMTYSGIKG